MFSKVKSLSYPKIKLTTFPLGSLIANLICLMIPVTLLHWFLSFTFANLFLIFA